LVLVQIKALAKTCFRLIVSLRFIEGMAKGRP
jgi:hypothetical protein